MPGASLGILGGGSGGKKLDPGNFMPIFDSKTCGSSTEDQCWTPMPVGGYLNSLYMTLENAPGNGDGYRFVVRKNGADTSLYCDILAGSFNCSNTTDTVTYAAGDRMSIRILTTPGLNTPGDSIARFTALYDALA